MIELNNLVKVYPSGDMMITALNIPALRIESGESFGLVGNNGAGKTTMFRMILDLIKPEQGEVINNGDNVASESNWRSYTGAYLDEGFLIDYLTPDEYFKFIARLHDMDEVALEAFYEKFKLLFNDEILGRGKYIRDLSKGNQKKVGIAAALMFAPEVLVLDEPFANLDPTTVIRLKELLIDLRDNKNITMLISSHDLSHVTEVCRRIAILDHGIITHDMQTGETTLHELEEYFGQS